MKFARVSPSLFVGAFCFVAASVAVTSAAVADREEGRAVISVGSARDGRAPRYVVLGRGRHGAVKWAILAFRRPGPGDAEAPCIKEIDQIYRGVTAAVACGAVAPPRKEPVRTEFSTVLPAGKYGREVPITVLGMTFATSVRSVKLRMYPGPDVLRETSLLQGRRAKVAGLLPFRYLAFALHRRSCVESITGFDQSGNQVLATPVERCIPG